MKFVTRLYYHPKFIYGGAERQMELICRELLNLGVDSNIIAKKFFKHQRKFEIINGVKVHNMGYHKFNISMPKVRERILNIFYSYDLILFLKNFRKFNFDIFQLRGANNIVGVWAFFAKIIKRKKFVFTVAHIRNCIPKSYSWSKLTYKIYEYGLKRADVVIVLANYMKKALYQNYGVKSVVIRSGHPIPSSPFKKDNPPTILWISRLIDWKRPELFLKIAEELKNINAQFLLIGPSDYMKNNIIQFSKKQRNFIYIPGVPSGEDNKYYEKASLVVNTSIYEGYPNSFIQAWLRETPVVSLDVDPDCDICKHGLGFHAKGDLNAMINKIKEFIENPSKLKGTGKRSREYAIKNFDIKKTAEQHYKLFKWLLR